MYEPTDDELIEMATSAAGETLGLPVTPEPMPYDSEAIEFLRAFAKRAAEAYHAATRGEKR